MIRPIARPKNPRDGSEVSPKFPLPSVPRSPHSAPDMKRIWSLFLVLGVCLGLCLPAGALDSNKSKSGDSTTPPAPAQGSSKVLPGVEIAQTISQVTGIAISPLMGVGVVGAWKYFKTPEPQRAQLSWYAQPWFWVPAMLVVLMCFAKDAAGPAIPTALKKPFDIAEVFENKLSGLVATGAIVPMAFDIFKTFGVGNSADLAGAGFAAINLGPLYGALMVPIALMVYAVVFVVSHAINILILISPFATVDAALKTFRLFILSTVAGTSFFDEKAGAIWALLIILVCAFLAGWAFRLLIFGHVFAWDLLTLRRKRFTPWPGANWAFLARKVAGVPARTYGQLALNPAGKLVFSYRPWLVLPQRTVELPEGRYAIGRGFFHPELLVEEDGSWPDVINFPPRCQSHEEALASIYGLKEVQDVGFMAAWSWFKSLFGGAPAPAR